MIISQNYNLLYSLYFPHQVWIALPLVSKALWETQEIKEESHPAAKKLLVLAPEKFHSLNSSFHVITQYKVHL